jgi:hypothetical protein
LQARQLFGDGFDSLSKGEIIPFSGVSKSGAGASSMPGALAVPFVGHLALTVQPTLTSANAMLQIFKLFFSICKFSGVFCIKRGDITLTYCYIVNGFLPLFSQRCGIVGPLFLTANLTKQDVNKQERQE